MQKESPAAQEEMRRIREEVDRNDERFRQLSDKVDDNKMADAEMAAELQEAGRRKKEEAVMLRKRWIATWRRWWNKFSLGEQIRRGLSSMLCAKFSRNSRPITPMCRCQGKMEDEGIVKTNKSNTKPVSSWRCQRQVGAMKALQRVVWSLIFLGFGVHLVNAEEQGSQVQRRMIEKTCIKLPKSTSHGGRRCFTGGLVKW